MKTLTAQEEAALAEFKRRVLETVADRVVGFRLFGSRARGEGDEESDLDVLVLLKEMRSDLRNRIIEIAADILVEYEIDVSPLVMSQDHFIDMKNRERLLPQEIERDGRPI